VLPCPLAAAGGDCTRGLITTLEPTRVLEAEDKGAAIDTELPFTLLTFLLPLAVCNGIADAVVLARALPPHCGDGTATLALTPVGKQCRSRVSTTTPLRCIGKKKSPTCSQSLPKGMPWMTVPQGTQTWQLLLEELGTWWNSRPSCSDCKTLLSTRNAHGILEAPTGQSADPNGILVCSSIDAGGDCSCAAR